MLSVEEAQEIVLRNLPSSRVENIHFSSASGRVLAEEIRATMDIPPFRRATMDGFALRAADVQEPPAKLRLVGEIRAGGGVTFLVRPGEVVSIMTGAPVPEGADAVQMVELTERSSDGSEVRILKKVTGGENIVPAGFEAARNQVVLEPGRLLGPAEMAVLATFGIARLSVYARPTVALLATGDELVEVDQAPRSDQIRNSNAHSIGAQLRLMGLEAEYLGIVRDNRAELKQNLEEALSRDVVILTGGVSAGEYDFVKAVFEGLGCALLFTKVAMKPGKPTVFARKGDKLIFGLPGNPVSTFVAFENFARLALGRMSGHRKSELPRVRGELLAEMRQKPGRKAFLPAWASRSESGWTIEPLPWRGSGDIIGFSRSNAMVIFPGERDCMRRGEIVEAMLLSDFEWRTRSERNFGGK